MYKTNPRLNFLKLIDEAQELYKAMIAAGHYRRVLVILCFGFPLGVLVTEGTRLAVGAVAERQAREKADAEKKASKADAAKAAEKKGPAAVIPAVPAGPGRDEFNAAPDWGPSLLGLATWMGVVLVLGHRSRDLAHKQRVPSAQFRGMYLKHLASEASPGGDWDWERFYHLPARYRNDPLLWNLARAALLRDLEKGMPGLGPRQLSPYEPFLALVCSGALSAAVVLLARGGRLAPNLNDLALPAAGMVAVAIWVIAWSAGFVRSGLSDSVKIDVFKKLYESFPPLDLEPEPDSASGNGDPVAAASTAEAALAAAVDTTLELDREEPAQDLGPQSQSGGGAIEIRGSDHLIGKVLKAGSNGDTAAGNGQPGPH